MLNDKRCIVIVTHDDRIYEFADRILQHGRRQADAASSRETLDA